MPKLILDVMGGDHGPQANLEGAVEALPALEGELILIIDEKVAQTFLTQRQLKPLAEAVEQGSARPGCKVRLVHSSEAIDMGDTIRTIRNKPGASINLGCKMAADDWKTWKSLKTGQPSAFISAGHSGAMMASALLNMGRLKGVERPAIAVKLPTLSVDGCIVLDVGANVDCKPEHLRDFAIMGALFGHVERKSQELPKVGVLSNGEEKSKGNELTRAAVSLIEQLPCFDPKLKPIGNFVGYSEGKEIFKGQVDVVITDGFVGNVVLKSVEGLGSAIVTLLKELASNSKMTSLGFWIARNAFKGLKKKLDYAEYGAAPLLGVAGYAFICHGRSNPKAIKNALLRAQSAVNTRLVERLEEALSLTFVADKPPPPQERGQTK